jgi:hypothetical protein
MSIASTGGLITNIVGMGLVAGVAIKTVDMVNQSSQNAIKSHGKKGKKSQSIDDIFDFNFNDSRKKKSKKRRRNDDDIFGMGSFY